MAVSSLELVAADISVAPVATLRNIRRTRDDTLTDDAPLPIARAVDAQRPIELLNGHEIGPLHQNGQLKVEYHRKHAPDPHQLSGRELDVFCLVALGHSNKLIARKLEIAEATVKVHVKAILRKLGLQNRTQAAIWALEHGFGKPAEEITLSRDTDLPLGDTHRDA